MRQLAIENFFAQHSLSGSKVREEKGYLALGYLGTSVEFNMAKSQSCLQKRGTQFDIQWKEGIRHELSQLQLIDLFGPECPAYNALVLQPAPFLRNASLPGLIPGTSNVSQALPGVTPES